MMLSQWAAVLCVKISGNVFSSLTLTLADMKYVMIIFYGP